MLQKLPGRVAIEDNVVFGRGGGRDLTCEVFTPPDDRNDRAAILIIHGGGWVQGDRSQLRGYGIQLARLGFLTVCSEYRLSTEAKWPAQIQDVNAAIRWMRANAATLGLDPAKIAISGNSAGGHLALMAAGAAHVAEFQGDGGHPQVSSALAACVAIYPPTLLKRSADPELNGALDLLFGADAGADVEDAASPLNYAGPNFPPTLLIHGNADELVPVEASLEMYRALREAGADCELHIYDGVPHAFDGVPEFGRQVTDLMGLFLDRKVANPRRATV